MSAEYDSQRPWVDPRQQETETDNFRLALSRIALNVTYRLDTGITTTLTGYAYETISGKAIIAGVTKGPADAEPSSSLKRPTHSSATLGTLALGAPGLAIWKRRESLPPTS